MRTIKEIHQEWYENLSMQDLEFMLEEAIENGGYAELHITDVVGYSPDDINIEYEEKDSYWIEVTDEEIEEVLKRIKNDNS